MSAHGLRSSCHATHSPWQAFVTETCVGCLIGLFVYFLTLGLHAIPAFRALEQHGSNAAMRLFAVDAPLPTEKRTVLVIVDGPTAAAWDRMPDGTRAQRLTSLIRSVRQSSPRSVVVDILFEGQIAPPVLAALRDELSTVRGAPVILPFALLPTGVPGHWLTAPNPLHELDGKGDVQFGVATLVPDRDGVIRTMAPAPCVRVNQVWRRVPTLAGLARGQHPDHAPCPAEPGIDDGDAHPEAILFYLDGRTADARHRAAVIPASEAEARADELRDAIVVIGQTGPDAWEDTRTSPLGPMPGTFIQANAIMTPYSGHAGEDGHGMIKMLEFAAMAAGALAFATFASAKRGLISWLEDRRGEGLGRGPALGIELVFYVAPFLLMLVLVGALWNYVAAVTLRDGVVIGALIPVFGACVEKTLDFGKLLLGWLEGGMEYVTDLLGLSGLVFGVLVLFGVAWIAQPVGRAVLGAMYRLAGHGALALGWLRHLSFMLLLCSGAAAFAQPAGRLTFTEGNVLIQRKGTDATAPARAGDPLSSLDTLVLRDRAIARLRLHDWPEETHQGPAEYLVPSKPPSSLPPGWRGAFAGFFQMALRSGPAPQGQAAVSHVWRGLPGPSGSGLSEPLQAIDALGSGDSLFLPNRAGLALAWHGGRPPYRVRLQAEANGAPLGQGSVAVPFVWWPDWQVPAEPARIVIEDATGRRLAGRMLPAARLPALPSGSGSGAAAAIVLFQATAGEWRLEAFRQLAAEAGSDPLADLAITLIRSAR